MLSADDFAAFFHEIHGVEPFPWQKQLTRRIAKDGAWPDTLDLPTGSGKTAAIDIAVFHLALEVSREQGRRAPVRIAFVVDRRLVVDDAFERAKKLADALNQPVGPVTSRVAERLKKLSLDGPALLARRLRGGIPREDDWARTPSQPTVLCSTVDQIGSRLLFRGYGVSDSMKPVHAGLLGSDCLLLLDEVHLAEPFRQTLRWVQVYKTENWHQVDVCGPWQASFLSATPGEEPKKSFNLDDEDWHHPVLQRRLNASKPARLLGPTKRSSKAQDQTPADEHEIDAGEKDIARRAAAIVEEIRGAVEHFQKAENGAPVPAVGVVVNRVARARAVFELVNKEFRQEIESDAVGGPILMIGPARQVDRDDLARQLDPIRTRPLEDGDVRPLLAPLIVIATQCIEAGVDIDLDALITEAAPVDALRQRFGRLNRAGRKITPYGAIIASKTDLSARQDDPVYGTKIRPAWEYLIAKADGTADGVPLADFGIAAFNRRMKATPIPSEAVSEKIDAPILLPAHLDLLSQTSPLPGADPDIALYLHGSKRQPDSIAVIWRADLDADRGRDEDARRVLTLVPPRPGEIIELPLWAVRRWLVSDATQAFERLADVAVSEPEDEARVDRRRAGRRVFRWKGDDERSKWVDASRLSPGDTIVVPSSYGRCDEFGWNPRSTAQATDVARKAAAPFMGRRFAVRVAPGLVESSVSEEALADALAGAVSRHWKDIRTALLTLGLPDVIRADLVALENARRRDRVFAYTDVYGSDEQGRARGVIFYAPFGIRGMASNSDGQPHSSEDDTIGSLPGYDLALTLHNSDVAAKAGLFGDTAGLPAGCVGDLRLAGRLHDAGKADPRFQAWLHYGDPLGPAPDHLLAKSRRRLPRQARDASGLPDRWRHEALSVRLACAERDLVGADDPALVLWLVGTHHGHGRPLFPHRDPAETAPDVGPQSLAFDWESLDWPTLFERLKSRYGVWELARMEAVLRLADHRASEERAAKEGSE